MVEFAMVSAPHSKEGLLPVTQEDADAAREMLNHAFRNASDRAFRHVEFRDIAEAFARHRLSHSSRGGEELREAASLVYRIEAAGSLEDEGSNFERWKASARDLAPRLRAALASPPPVDRAEAKKDAEIKRLRGLLIDPGSPPWEDARAVLVAELRKSGFKGAAKQVEEGEGCNIPSHVALNLIAQAAQPLEGLTSMEGKTPREVLKTMQRDRSTNAGRAAYRLLRRIEGEHVETYTEREDWLAIVEALAASPANHAGLMNGEGALREAAVEAESLLRCARMGGGRRVTLHPTRVRVVSDRLAAALAASPANHAGSVGEAFRPMDAWDKRDEPVMLLVDYRGDGDHPLEDANFAITVGHNNDHNVGEGEGSGWHFAGWCWSHDHYIEGRGIPVGWMPLPHILARAYEAFADEPLHHIDSRAAQEKER